MSAVTKILVLFGCAFVLFVLPVGNHLAIGLGDAFAGVQIKTNVKYYDVKGRTGLELAKSMIRLGPKASGLQHAIASTTPDLKFGKAVPVANKRHCRIKDIDIFVTLTYTYPRWKAEASGTKKMRSAWRDLMDELVKHEETHGRIVIETANKIHREILKERGLVSRNCSDFGKRIGRRMPQIVKSYTRRQQSFDRRERSFISRVSRLQRKLIQAD